MPPAVPQRGDGSQRHRRSLPNPCHGPALPIFPFRREAEFRSLRAMSRRLHRLEDRLEVRPCPSESPPIPFGRRWSPPSALGLCVQRLLLHSSASSPSPSSF